MYIKSKVKAAEEVVELCFLFLALTMYAGLLL